ncbi:ABC transporter substrate-binding protein [Hazenella sp. IB182357]|uniref:ABC transporter substrate-binding protein n=1 Tax=Polycladospora coralii TaxID=2771432 RepID=A0A926N6A1_9BACL|nr:ABC transporter substrate-binding protein [Polycladospora coralii]MBD1371801.1 ABC transporter substrate-binding protein [Polycladospora coralii]
MYRVKKLVIGLMIILLTLLVACQSTDGQDKKVETITLVEVTHSIFYAPQYVSKNLGFFTEENIEIEWVNGNGGDKTMTALLADQADIILVGAEAGLYVTARSQSTDISAFAQLTQTDGSFLVARHPITPFTWEQLKGKTLLGQRRGGMPQMVSEYVQKQNQIIPHQDVALIQNIDYKNLSSAFVAGTGDFVQLFEPMASKIEAQGYGKIVASFGTESGHLPYTCYLTKKSKQDPELLKRFTRAIQKGQSWVKTHSATEIASVIQEDFPDISKENLIQVVDRYKKQASYAEDTIIDEEEYQRMLTIMKEANELPKVIPYDLYINTTYAEEVKQELKQE